MNKQEQWCEYWENNNTTIIGNKIFKEKRKVLSEFLEYFLGKNVKNIIEIGYGNCELTKVLHKYKNFYDYTSIDYADPNILIKYIQKQYNIEKRNMFDIVEKYDLVFSDGLLEHYKDFKKYIKKMCSISKKYVLLIQPDHSTLSYRLLLVLEKIFGRDKTNVYEYNFPIDDFIIEFEKNKFIPKIEKGVYYESFKFLLFEKQEN